MSSNSSSPSKRITVHHNYDPSENQPAIFANSSLNQRRTRSGGDEMQEHGDEDLSHDTNNGSKKKNSAAEDDSRDLFEKKMKITNNKPRMETLYVESKILKRWKPRWVVLDESAICAFENEQHWKSRLPPVTAIFTEDIAKALVSVRDDKIVLLESKNGEVLKLKFPDRSRAFEWKVDILNRSFKKKK